MQTGTLLALAIKATAYAGGREIFFRYSILEHAKDQHSTEAEWLILQLRVNRSLALGRTRTCYGAMWSGVHDVSMGC